MTGAFASGSSNSSPLYPFAITLAVCPLASAAEQHIVYGIAARRSSLGRRLTYVRPQGLWRGCHASGVLLRRGSVLRLQLCNRGGRPLRRGLQRADWLASWDLTPGVQLASPCLTLPLPIKSDRGLFHIRAQVAMVLANTPARTFRSLWASQTAIATAAAAVTA